MTSDEIRQQFLDFFKDKDHRIVPSAPVVPFDDPTLLFTNAGMNQFKDVFLGKGNRDYKRAADTQKCIRVSGKHNDLEEVGNDTYHHTFFEMLGNWSFGDYYKAEAISWAWELLTKVWKLPKERLWATVFRTDDEAFEYWKTKTDINPDHILRFGEKDNFWEMGETGPCGPCSEIHINLGADYNNPGHVNAGTPECIEIWNLVFIQYDRDEAGKIHDLPLKHIDTGMGFERVCAVLQDKDSNYDTDIFMPLINKISEMSGVAYKKENDKIPMRVISDHIRTLAFAIADGAVPGNEGRGYVLRRILRRASRYGRNIDLHKPFLFELVDVLVKTMGNIFPEIKEKKNYIKKVIRGEEESFNVTLDRGIELFNDLIKGLKKEKLKVIPGEDVFKLYDTYGFPVDLTNVMARENGFTIDEEGFNELMQLQQQRGRDASKEKFASVNISANDLNSFKLIEPAGSEFTGYDELESKSKIVGYKKDNGNDLIILNKTPFYVEAGGQIDDHGKLIIQGDLLPVIDVARVDNKTIHVVENENREIITPGLEVIAHVDEKRRWDIMRNHTATHFLHAALRKVLGNHVHQAGSYVGPDRLRFDFTHFSKLSESEILEIESLVNEQLRRNIPLQHHRNIPFDQAKKMGALMFFGDKYGDKVNVVQFGDFSMEFCGGTHVENSSEIGLFKIISESSIASGVRRIEAVTGLGIEGYINSQLNKIRESEERIAALQEEKKKLEKDLSEFKLKEKLGQVENILKNPIKLNHILIYKGEVNAENMDELKSFGDELRNRTKGSVGVLISRIEDKAAIVCVVNDELLKSTGLSAGKIVGSLAKIVGGGGGGRPHLATAGGKDFSRIPDALRDVEKTVQSFL
jgi:alanyl-tRNA synthetase